MLLVIVGAQWGDEGKGKLTDYLAQNCNVVVRTQGGNNAGHTITINNEKFKLQTIPSGVFNEKIKNILGNGMAINPKALCEEIDGLKKRGFNRLNLYISNRSHIVMPYHIDIDSYYENFKTNKIGTTKKGIGPCYSDKINRIGIRMCDFVSDNFKNVLAETLKIKNEELKSLGLIEYDLEKLYLEYKKYANILKEYVCDTSILLYDEIEKNSNILFEGAQGSMLCIEHGTYPYVTSSSPTSASVPLNIGIAPTYINKTLGIMKAYTTRVGEGPFATELSGDIANYIRERGNEYGTVTKRPRRVGYLDLVVVKHSKRISGITSFALMLLDVLTSIKTLKICISYNLDGKEIDYIPASVYDYQRCTPNYIELKVWNDDISKCKTYDELPKECKEYISTIEKYLNSSIDIISVGPNRDSTIIRNDIFKR